MLFPLVRPSVEAFDTVLVVERGEKGGHILELCDVDAWMRRGYSSDSELMAASAKRRRV